MLGDTTGDTVIKNTKWYTGNTIVMLGETEKDRWHRH